MNKKKTKGTKWAPQQWENFMKSLYEMEEQKCVKLLKRIESKCKRVVIMKKKKKKRISTKYSKWRKMKPTTEN